MNWRRDFPAAIVSVVLLCTVVAPSTLWAWFSIRAHAVQPWPEGLTSFMSWANFITISLLAWSSYSQRINPPAP
jgi:hypothetical protein